MLNKGILFQPAGIPVDAVGGNSSQNFICRGLGPEVSLLERESQKLQQAWQLDKLGLAIHVPGCLVFTRAPRPCWRFLREHGLVDCGYDRQYSIENGRGLQGQRCGAPACEG